MQRTRPLLGENFTCKRKIFTRYYIRIGGNMEEAKWILKKFYPNAHISSDRQLCEESGVNYCTFRKRMRYPDTIRLYEFEALNEVLQMDDEGILTFIKCIITPKQSGRGGKKTT